MVDDLPLELPEEELPKLLPELPEELPELPAVPDEACVPLPPVVEADSPCWRPVSLDEPDCDCWPPLLLPLPACCCRPWRQLLKSSENFL